MEDDKLKIVSFPNRDSDEQVADATLEESKGIYESVVVFGRCKDSGVLKCTSNVGDLGSLNLMLDQLKLHLIDSTFDEIYEE